MRIITRDQSLAKACEIAEETPVTPVEIVCIDAFVLSMETYFPEFEGVRSLAGYYFARRGPVSFFHAAGAGGFMFDIEVAADRRYEMYAYEYSECGSDAVLYDLFDTLTFGAPKPGTRDELHRVCRDVSGIWTSFYYRWGYEFARMKTGMGTEILDWAYASGLDLSIRAYFDGVPVEYLLHSPQSLVTTTGRDSE